MNKKICKIVSTLTLISSFMFTTSIVNAASIGWKLNVSTPIEKSTKNWYFDVGLYNNDSIPDLYAVKINNSNIEVHLFNGEKNYQKALIETATPYYDNNSDFAVRDYNGNGVGDLYCFKKIINGHLEIHILNGANNFQSFLTQVSTPITIAPNDDWAFCIGDYNGDGISDVYCLKKNAYKSTEIHILDGKTNFQTFLLQTATALGNTNNDNWDFTTDLYDNDRKADLYCIQKNGSQGTAELYVLSANSNFKTYIAHDTTPLNSSDKDTSNIYNQYGSWDNNLYAIKPQGGSNTEIHKMDVKNKINRRALVLGETSSPAVPYNDVTSMYNMFRSNKFGTATIDTTLYANHTKAEITNKINSTFSASSSNDVNYIYMTCHGGKDGKIIIGKNGLEGYTGSELRTLLDKLKGNYVIMLDCCYAGTAINKDVCDNCIDNFINDFNSCKSGELLTSKYTLICSSNKTETSRGGSINSLATKYWNLGLGWDGKTNTKCLQYADTNSDKLITLNELHNYSYNKVYSESLINSPQHVVSYSSNPNVALFSN